MMKMPPWLVRELRSDHAGETGAVAIYQGILAVSRDSAVVNFAKNHLATERDHLALMDQLLPNTERSRLLFLWRVAGFFTGCLPALFSSNSVFRTVEAVEIFVDVHYSAQINRLRLENIHGEIRQKIETCRNDERHHRDDARQRVSDAAGIAISLWLGLVTLGSRIAVVIARAL
ncbi:MAG: hypothetical protein CBD27_02720 [Rhodospirillaceae bacterium TMED167]|nr:ubiquinone biosynthesis protein COQ7 [Rhodospirillaceae bacterium]OUW29610.1 MAG: hypothetical protein CBD27_02720 [Rhodospirillaceae bacterium TMED167]